MARRQDVVTEYRHAVTDAIQALQALTILEGEIALMQMVGEPLVPDDFQGENAGLETKFENARAAVQGILAGFTTEARAAVYGVRQ